MQFSAPTAASADTITVTLTDHNTTTFSVAIASTFNSADSARTVACEFVSAANALFSAQGVSYNAYETSAGEVKVTFSNSPSITLSTFTAAITTGTTGIIWNFSNCKLCVTTKQNYSRYFFFSCNTVK